MSIQLLLHEAEERSQGFRPAEELFGHEQWKLGLLHDLEAALDRLVRGMDPKEVSLMGWASRPWRTHRDILELLTRLRMELAEDIELPFDPTYTVRHYAPRNISSSPPVSSNGSPHSNRNCPSGP